jgi:outer membrane usher protein
VTAFQVDINRQGLKETVLALRAKDGTLYLLKSDLQRWGLKIPAEVSMEYQGQRFVPLAKLAGVSATVDTAKQALNIDAVPDAFSGERERLQEQPWPMPTRSSLGGFFNYNLLGQTGAGAQDLSGLFEAGVFGPYGVLTNSSALNLSNVATTTASFVRLDTTWFLDNPAEMTSLRLGDSITRTGEWGRPVRFGGIQYGTDFATRPGFITFPLQAASGVAALPSVVDVFVNGSRVGEQPIKPGPFSITNIPPVTGQGDVQLVVRDATGREQVITQPFYASAQLLRPGLEDFSYQAGFLRNNYGLESNDYGPAFGSALYRRGMTDRLTLEGAVEATPGIGAGGVVANYLVDDIAVLTAGGAASGGEAGPGALGLIGFQHIDRRFSVGARATWTTAEFRQVGLPAGELPPERVVAADASYQTGHYGILSLAWADEVFRHRPRAGLVAGAYTITAGRFGFISMSLSYETTQPHTTTALLTLTVPLGAMTTATFGAQRTRNAQGIEQSELSAGVQQSLPVGEGWGYRLFATNHHNLQAGVSAQNNIGTYTLDAARFNDENFLRAGVAGGIGLVGGHPFLARELDTSFAVVRVGDFPDVTVYQDNQPVGRTDRSGLAVLPRLRAYDRNPVSVELDDLPADAKLDGNKLVAVPYARSGLLLDFPVARQRGVLLQIVLDDGEPLPPSSVVVVEGRAEEFPVAYHGEVYLTDLGVKNRLRAIYGGQSCDFELNVPATAEAVQKIGPVACSGVRR